MDYLKHSFLEPSVTQSLLVPVLTISIGLLLASKFKIKSFSLGITWILFCGILLSLFGMCLETHVEHFAKDFGLILFVSSIGLQVGPSFFSSFGKEHLKLNRFTCAIVLLLC